MVEYMVVQIKVEFAQSVYYNKNNWTFIWEKEQSC